MTNATMTDSKNPARPLLPSEADRPGYEAAIAILAPLSASERAVIRTAVEAVLARGRTVELDALTILVDCKLCSCAFRPSKSQIDATIDAMFFERAVRMYDRYDSIYRVRLPR